jgi:hypothetical protein
VEQSPESVEQSPESVEQSPESVEQSPESFSIISEYFRSKGWLLKVAIPCSWKTPPLFSFRKRGKSLKRLLFVAVARRQTAQLCLWRLATAFFREQNSASAKISSFGASGTIFFKTTSARIFS